MDELLKEGSRFLVREKGIGTDADLEAVPFHGHFHDAHGEHLSASAKSLGLSQLGTLGRGRSHFVEVGVVDEVHDRGAADQLKLTQGCVTVLIHSGARALGERTYVEAVGLCMAAMKRLRMAPSPRGLAYAPLDSEEGLWCYHALRAAANYSWANRHVLTHQARLVFQRIFSDRSAQLRVACDSPSNTVDLDRIDGRLFCLHRHAATSARGPGINDQVPPAYRELGTPMVLPGSMGSSSYVLIATEAAESLSLASACHGAGRVMSRKEAKKTLAPHELKERLAQQDVVARSPEPADLRTQIPEAYRDVEKVLAIMERAGLARRVARIRPRGVLKG
jgi:tRNA-splicing ligase RtcB